MTTNEKQSKQGTGKQAEQQNDWMRRALGVSVLRVRFDSEEQLGKLVRRWRATLEYTRQLQDPTERVRVLLTVPASLNVEHPDPKSTAQTEAQALWTAVNEARRADEIAALEDVKARVGKLVQGTAASLKKWRTQASGEHARELLETIESTESDLSFVREMADRLKEVAARLKAAQGVGDGLDEVQHQLHELKQIYVRLIPKRTGKGEPGQPEADAPPPEEYVELETKVIQKLETQGAADPSEALDPGLLQQEVETLGKLLGGAGESTPARDPKKELEACGFSWDEVKARYQAMRQDKAQAGKAKIYMERMCWYRRQVVDEKMLELQKKYQFHWGSVGSKNPESDYDISVKTHGTHQGKPFYDWQIVAEFNADISKAFGGRQPGTIFDTNLYASADVQGPEGRGHAAKLTSPDMQAMTEQGQDVGALMKMRRYMDWEEYLSFQEETLKGLEGETRKAMLRQFEEADDLFFMSVKQQLDRADELDRAKRPGGKPPKQEEAPAPVTPGEQKKLLEQLAALEKDGDRMMAVNNALYVEAMDNVRKLEEALGKREPGSREYDATLAALKSKQADAVFFAAEAYHSEGPFKHVVWADQAVRNDPKLKGKKEEQDKEIARRLREITPTQMLQSFNENLGDLLKDIAHYSEKDPFPGLGFIRSSKYLGRLCDSMRVLKQKGADLKTADGRDLGAAIGAIGFAGKDPDLVKQMAEKLTALRGGKVVFQQGKDGVEDPVAEARAYAVEKVREVFGSGVATLVDLGTVAKKTGQQVNTLMRAAVAAGKMKAKSEKEYFRAFDKSGEKPA